MEEVNLEEFINSLDESYRSVFTFLEDKTLLSFTKSMIPGMKEKGLSAETILFDQELKGQIDTFIDGDSDKLLAIEALLKGLEYLENLLGSFEYNEGFAMFENTPPKMVSYCMIQYILSKKSKKNIQ